MTQLGLPDATATIYGGARGGGKRERVGGQSDSDGADDDGPRAIRPQPGPQERFLRSSADIAIYGGAAGSGKSWSLLLDPVYDIGIRQFYAVIFRRTSPQITNPGGLWDESMELYPTLGSDPIAGNTLHRFPSGSRIEFHHLQHEKSVYNWQGAQVPFFGFDELTHFTQAQFFYMLSRNRSMSGVKPRIRGTCNPDADSWVATFIAWWINQDTGLPILERSGVLRWFIRVKGTIVWGDSVAELKAQHGPKVKPKSVTFVAATIFDNPALLAKNPEYLANLEALSLVERERLLGGNWKIKRAAGLYFKREWIRTIERRPLKIERQIRAWDLAATVESEGNDPDWTVGTLLARERHGDQTLWYVLDRVKLRGTPLEVERAVLNTAERDGKATPISLPQDPGQAGKAQARRFAALLAGYVVRTSPETGDKVTRFEPFSAQCEAGNVFMLKAGWNDDWMDCLEAFPETKHDDDADSVSRAFNELLASPRVEYAGQITRVAAPA